MTRTMKAVLSLATCFVVSLLMIIKSHAVEGKAMIHIQTTAVIIRIYDGDNTYEDRDKYSGIMSGSILDSKTIFLYGAQGAVTRRQYRLIYSQLLQQGFTTVQYERKGAIHSIDLLKVTGG